MKWRFDGADYYIGNLNRGGSITWRVRGAFAANANVGDVSMREKILRPRNLKKPRCKACGHQLAVSHRDRTREYYRLIREAKKHVEKWLRAHGAKSCKSK